MCYKQALRSIRKEHKLKNDETKRKRIFRKN